MVTIGSREGELQGDQFGGFWKKCNYAETEGSIKTISQGFAANDITNIVLKCGDNRTKRRGVTKGVNLRNI